MTDHPAVKALTESIPAAVVVGAQIFDLTLPDWAAIFGMVFIVVQVVYLIWKWRKEAKHP